MPKLFSYVVDHDCGYAPYPFGGFCTLAKCKYGTIKTKHGTRRNIVELADEGDWIAGTGGVVLDKSAGHGKLIYAMRVDEKISLREYCQGNRGNRIDAEYDVAVEGRFALISFHYFYFGRKPSTSPTSPGRTWTIHSRKPGRDIGAISARCLSMSSPNG